MLFYRHTALAAALHHPRLMHHMQGIELAYQRVPGVVKTSVSARVLSACRRAACVAAGLCATAMPIPSACMASLYAIACSWTAGPCGRSMTGGAIPSQYHQGMMKMMMRGMPRLTRCAHVHDPPPGPHASRSATQVVQHPTPTTTQSALAARGTQVRGRVCTHRGCTLHCAYVHCRLQCNGGLPERAE